VLGLWTPYQTVLAAEPEGHRTVGIPLLLGPEAYCITFDSLPGPQDINLPENLRYV
jgi:hypothetical protein